MDEKQSLGPPARRLLSRRRLLVGGAIGAGALAAGRAALPAYWRSGPVRVLEGAAAAFAESALAGIDREALWDVHVHLVGLGATGNGCWVHPDMRSHFHPIRRLQFDAYVAASGIDPDAPGADESYVERLLALQHAGNPSGRVVLLAFDWNHGDDGEPDRNASTFHVPNDYVLRIAGEHEEFAACASVHPYRRDALEELERVASRGALAVKWLPNSMGMDPASPRCDAFYQRLVELDLPLLVHTGRELAVASGDAQELGNPMRLRRALEAGVRVIAAHCAGTGTYRDPDRALAPPRSSFELFLELFEDPRYARTFFADLSAMTQVNRAGAPLRTMLARRDLHERLLFGSDYPLPAIRGVVSTRILQARGYLTSEQRERCDEVFEANPLLCDLLVKRSLAIEVDGVRRGFEPCVFETARAFPRQA